MKQLRAFVLGLALAVGLTAVWGAVTEVSITSPSALQVAVTACCIDFATGDLTCDLPYSVTATGSQLDTKHFRAPGNNGPIVDTTTNTVIAASVPSGVSTPRDSLMSGINSALTTAAAAGKFNR